jgi:hypothetical protein
MAMLSKHAFPYTGIAHECFFGAVYEHVLVENMSREECILMVSSKKCEDAAMTFVDTQNNECSYKANLIEQHQWMADRVVTGYDCEVSTTTIIESEPLEEARFLGCPLTDLLCKWGNKTVVWEESVFKNCPFDFDQEQLVNWTARGNDFLFNNGHYLKVVAKLDNVSNCGNAQIFNTAEGVYLAFESEYNSLKKAGVRLVDEVRYSSSLYRYQSKKQKCENLVARHAEVQNQIFS